MRRRGRHLLLSPVDWALVDSWEKRGVPLRIVLGVIDEVFDQIDDDPKRTGSVRSLSYCKDAVENRYRSWVDSQVGSSVKAKEPVDGKDAAAAAAPIFPKSAVEEHLRSVGTGLAKAAAAQTGEIADVLRDACAELETLAAGIISQDDLEARLEELDERIDDALTRSLDAAELEAETEAAAKAIGVRRAVMDDEGIERTARLLLRKRLRERSKIPRLGLFYL